MTRAIYGFRRNNKDKITFSQGDGDLRNLGKKIIKFIKSTSINQMEDIFDKIILVDSLQEATEEQIEKCKKYANLRINTRSLKDFKCLLSESFGRLEAYRDEGLEYMIDASKEISNPHLCEYAYIINLDTNEIEIYTLMFKEVLEDRYNQNTKEKTTSCRLIKKYKLDNIPSNWVKECEQVIFKDMCVLI